MGIQETLARNTGFVFISHIVNRIISLFFIAYAARVLGPGDFGIYALLGTVTFLFFFCGDVGIGPMAIREISRNRERAKELFNNIFSLRITLVILAYPILVLIINLLGYGEDVKYLIYISGLSAIFSTISSSFRILYVAFERFKLPSLISILVSLLSNISLMIVLYLGYGLRGVVSVSFFGNVLGAVISGIWIRRKFIKYRFELNLPLWKDLIFHSIPFAIISFFEQANYHVNILLLSKLPASFARGEAMGYYKPASSICQGALLLPQSFRQAALPTIASKADDRKMVEGIIDGSTKTLIAVAIFPLVLASTFYPAEIITLIFGNKYLPSAPALTILGWAYALQIFNVPVSVTLSASREIKRFIPWAALVFCFNVILAIPLIIYYSFLGAAVALLFSKILETFLRNYLLQTIWGIKRSDIQEYLKILSPIAITIIILLIAKFSSISPLILFIMTLISYPLCIYFFKDFRQGISTIINGLGFTNKTLAKTTVDGEK